MAPFDFFCFWYTKSQRWLKTTGQGCEVAKGNGLSSGAKGGGKLSGRGRDNEVVSGAGSAGGYGTGDTADTRDRHSAVTGHHRGSLRGPLVALVLLRAVAGPEVLWHWLLVLELCATLSR